MMGIILFILSMLAIILLLPIIMPLLIEAGIRILVLYAYYIDWWDEKIG